MILSCYDVQVLRILWKGQDNYLECFSLGPNNCNLKSILCLVSNKIVCEQEKDPRLFS